MAWIQKEDKYGEFDRRFNEWIPHTYYECSDCGMDVVKPRDVCPKCKREVSKIILLEDENDKQNNQIKENASKNTCDLDKQPKSNAISKGKKFLIILKKIFGSEIFFTVVFLLLSIIQIIYSSYQNINATDNLFKVLTIVSLIIWTIIFVGFSFLTFAYFYGRKKNKKIKEEVTTDEN